MKHLLLAAGLLLALGAQAQQARPVATGCIEGKLDYAADYFPTNMTVTAEPVTGAGHSYTTMNTRHQHYRLCVPPGTYYVYAATRDLPNYEAYYSQLVTCGKLYSCPSHAKIAVVVKAGV